MGIYVKAEYLQIVHYYFFSLGIFSLTSAFLFWDYTIYSYLFVGFYILHSAISWYVSWVMYTRMQEVLIIKSRRYALSHIVLTLWTGGLAVVMWLLFEIEYESMMTSLLMINFFVIFLGGIWYIIGKFKVSEKYFEWQDRGKLDSARRAVMDFRETNKLKVVEDWIVDEYSWGSNESMDRLFIQAKRRRDEGDVRGFAEAARGIEMGLCDERLSDIDRKMSKMRKEEKPDEKLLKTYQDIAIKYRKEISEYDKHFYGRFGK